MICAMTWNGSADIEYHALAVAFGGRADQQCDDFTGA
jgi:hypothetical protein